MKLLVENAMKEGREEKDVIVLLGNIRDPETDKRFDQCVAFGIGRKNFDMGFSGQLLMKCPKTKVKKLLATFPIREEKLYWQTTHTWEGATVK